MAWLKSAGYIGDHDLRTSENTKAYSDAMEQVCSRYGAHFIDCFGAFTRAVTEGLSLSQLLYDGIHYTPAGYSVSAETI